VTENQKSKAQKRARDGGLQESGGGDGSGNPEAERPRPVQWAEMSKRQRKNWKQRHQREGERDPEAYLPHKCQRLRFPVGFSDMPTEIWASHSPLPIFGFVRPTSSEHEFSTVKLGPTICERPTICEKRRTKTYHKYNYLLSNLQKKAPNATTVHVKKTNLTLPLPVSVPWYGKFSVLEVNSRKFGGSSAFLGVPLYYCALEQRARVTCFASVSRYCCKLSCTGGSIKIPPFLKLE